MPKPPPGWLVRANSAILSRGLRIGAQYLLTVPGRRSGQPRRTPVSVVSLDGSRYLVAAFEAADWVANIRAAGSGSLARGHTIEQVTFSELPPDERGPVLRPFLEQVPGGRRFFESADPELVVASAGSYPVFRVSAQIEPPGSGTAP
jgi:deazaflavin-dependent oxidoreductase (nitroreductase family)